MRKRVALMSLLMCTATHEYSQSRNPVRIIELMKQGKVAFGSMVQDRSAAGGAALAKDARLDLVFYDMELACDIGQLQEFLKGFRANGTSSRNGSRKAFAF